MIRSKKIKKQDLDQQILESMFQLKKQWTYLDSILDRSIDPTESGQFDLAITKAKYFYLMREARIRKLSANQ
ncbi:YaaL family protein [Gracilibacillus caseinilyticus]|uniref:YaaL family protein n=1 Tax=Gracilibacillus caseinilyticus TaxID=2932256 RepID=A0ABY4F0C5_9BACI|nr:YaaL family protein [Gracilibacillus caseinilyticus]UOQ49547.1 YaaL family protein [Gracilibacillus caseinilyticus]